MTADTARKETKWYTGEFQHEGFPLHLRFPEKPDFDALQKKHPRLLMVTHSLAEVKSSGVPEADYNDSLAEFDHDLAASFDASSGIIVLVETFGGNRTYYIYVSVDAAVEATKYPQHKLDWKLRDDPGWKFIRGYSEDYHLYKKG